MVDSCVKIQPFLASPSRPHFHTCASCSLACACTSSLGQTCTPPSPSHEPSAALYIAYNQEHDSNIQAIIELLFVTDFAEGGLTHTYIQL